ncbi:DinB family protein [Planomicrobium sp. CPCC 101110]|uniref:DinB family protein n=1 Tax=Planomicrobium sp. CPCC 101110 TaxID=2599619 RepID=UPI0011B8419C|nr:DinB family protein [Planomicrobium sp. CPCC 101110]TWT27156.1 DinB family protein [Planomicrobium sp. CPCC 101110]
MIDYQVSSLEGFTDKIGELCFLLEHARAATLSEIGSLSQAELDYWEHADDNSIGALLFHIASIEKVHQVISFEKRDFTASEFAEWGAGIDLHDSARMEIRGKGLDFYLQQLSDVREQTLKQLRLRGDGWLYEQNHWPNGTPYNNYYLWFHVLEDEISHRGQIRSIKRRITNCGKQGNGYEH